MLLFVTIALGAPDWLDDPTVALPPSAVVHAPDHLGALARAPLQSLSSRGLQIVRRTDGHVPSGLGWIPIRGSRAQLMALRADGRGRSSFIIQSSPGEIAQGQWDLACEGEVGVLDVYLLDFGQFARNAVMEVEHSVHTMGVPSTARGCIAVGAAAGQLAAEHESPGELRAFSSRGPALGGQKSIDLIAPEPSAQTRPIPARPSTAPAERRLRSRLERCW